MRGLLAILATLAVVALGYWAYSANYATQDAMRERRDLQREIADTKARLHMLDDEWAYLNRPDRLRDLVDLNYARLSLMAMNPDSFGRFDQVSFPPDPFEIQDVLDVDGGVVVVAEDQP